ncbi:MAG: hypothetical protein N3A69_00560 [Leptospiraceae bacterium]|nr:hypothetical protein [Leptospiraceae bacterium]
MNYLKNLFLALIFFYFYHYSINLHAQERLSMPTYENEWKKIEEKENLGKPQQALKLVLELQAKAKKEKNHAQLIKTLIYEMKFRSQREEEGFVLSIQRTQELLKDKVYGEFPTKQILHSLLAELYWRYFQENRYTFLNRTPTSTKPEDIRTWDLKTLVNATLENYLQSLQNPERLETYPIADLSPILHENRASRYLRSTLYDFLAHRAIDFLLNTQSGLPQPKEKFSLDYTIINNTNQKEFIYLQDAKAFFEYSIKTTDETSFLYHGIKIFQDLLKRKWLTKEKNPSEENISAFIDADLKRIEFVYNNSYIPEKDSLYLLALENVYKQYSKNPFSSQIKFLVAKFFENRASKYNPKLSNLYKWDHKTAYDICEDVIQKYPNTLGAKNCSVLQLEIKKKDLRLQ